MMKQFKLCMSNRKFIFTSLGTCGVILHMYLYTTVIGQLVAPFGITEQMFVIDMGLFVYGFGILGGVLFSIYLTYSPHQMMKSAFVVCILSIMTLAYFFFANTRADRTELLVSCSVLGFFLLPILFIAYELAVEQT